MAIGHSAQITGVSLDETNRIHIERIVFALDIGRVLNPNLVRSQVEGGPIFALSAVWGALTRFEA